MRVGVRVSARRGHERQRLEVERAEPVERGGGERVAGDVVDDAGEAADVAGGVEDAGLLLAGRAEAEEFHGECGCCESVA